MSVPTVSAVIMAFNEVNNLEAVVREIAGVLGALPDDSARSDEILIVDDGSSDGTGALADRLAMDRAQIPRLAVRVIHHPMNLGLGGVYRTGFAHAARELITFFPADGQFPADIIRTFYPLMDRHDLVLGYLPRRASSLVAKGLSAAEKLLYRLLFGRMPRYQGVFMVNAAVLHSLTLETTGRGWGVVMEMVLRIWRGHHRVTSIPTSLRPRASGRSKVNNLKTAWVNLRQAVALWRSLRAR